MIRESRAASRMPVAVYCGLPCARKRVIVTVSQLVYTTRRGVEHNTSCFHLHTYIAAYFKCLGFMDNFVGFSLRMLTKTLNLNSLQLLWTDFTLLEE